MPKLYTPKPVPWGPDFENTKKVLDENFTRLQEMDEAAKAAGTLVGRYITHPIADGQAYYQVVKENKRTVRIRQCTGLGDDWTVPAWGKEATIEKKLAVGLIGQRDALAELLDGKGRKRA